MSCFSVFSERIERKIERKEEGALCRCGMIVVEKREESSRMRASCERERGDVVDKEWKGKWAGSNGFDSSSTQGNFFSLSS
ncbi:hypothetical protein COLO4_20634 [Corchorus olitorius]|uniref:Uncharacterized protein n=1 Tax=Corchorus olitorius TaxID=93759 RepID=A0A1R3IYE1_9ROSI|nr:hypothetical protein COLO4_20634 [Corchorus olitorius]